MKFAINLPNFGCFGDARVMVDLACEAEDAGWDGFFIWDHLLWTEPTDQPVAEPWVALTAVAMATSRIKLAPLVTPLPRRRPWQVARQAATLDQLCNGRLILGVGIGVDWYGDYSRFDEPTESTVHGNMLDEGLNILAGLWSGKPFIHSGEHYAVTETTFLPMPIQRPRVPIWVAGRWPGTKPFRRAAEWDGVFPLSRQEEKQLSPRHYRDMLRYIKDYRQASSTFDMVTISGPAGATPQRVKAYADAGVTWWQIGFLPGTTVEEVRQIICRGPPSL